MLIIRFRSLSLKMLYVHSIFATLLLSVCYIKDTSACNGYNLRVNYVKNCLTQNVLQAKDLNATLDKDCNILPTGCVVATKQIKSAQTHYTITKAPMPPIEGDMELCEALGEADDPELHSVLSIFALPKKCPIPAKKMCSAAGKKFSIAKYKNQLGIALGTTVVKFDMTHNNGKSCLEMSFTFTKGRIG